MLIAKGRKLYLEKYSLPSQVIDDYHFLSHPVPLFFLKNVSVKNDNLRSPNHTVLLQWFSLKRYTDYNIL